ncbi:MAG TPA: tripartite tricarboxylate transporter TctB family protein [Luteibacter sp.]|nr:tripartite tricarboxylate transporter TctB family protein [Luteibacter sp.]
MRRSDAVLGVAVTLIGGGALWMATRMPFYSENTPGPGFFPVLVSSGLVIMGLILIRQSLRPSKPEVRAVGAVSQLDREAHGKAPKPPQGAPFIPARPLAVLIGFLACVPLLGVLGFVLTAILLFAYLLFFVEKRRSAGAIAATVTIPVVTWLLFVQLLGIELPNGLLRLGFLGI